MNREKKCYVIDLLGIARVLCGVLALLLIVQGDNLLLFFALSAMSIAEILNFFSWKIIASSIKAGMLEINSASVYTRIYHAIVFSAFLSEKWIPLWTIFLIFLADLTVPYIGTFLCQIRFELPARLTGKIKTIVHSLVQLGVVSVAMGAMGKELKPTDASVVALFYVAGLASIVHLIDITILIVRKQ